MRSTLYLKFVIVYIILGFLTFFTVATLNSELFEQYLLKEESSRLHRQAVLLADDYLVNYFTDDLTLYDVRVQLDAMSDYMDASAWFVDPQGTLLTSSSYEKAPCLHSRSATLIRLNAAAVLTSWETIMLFQITLSP